ncbi:MAG: hypothetical protein HW406_126 [Candidatus Brocadiaceae bacterium]|nr:hypothetical protein [Candidatus Brocadiaceae bacterium]
MSKTHSLLVLGAFWKRVRPFIPVLPQGRTVKGCIKADDERRPSEPRMAFGKIVYVLLACVGGTKGKRVGSLRTALTAGFILTLLFFISGQKGYSFDSIDSVTQFLDTLSYEYKGFDIKLKNMSMGETYDDNVTYVNENKLEDFITTLGVGIGALYEGKAKTLEITTNIGHQEFAKNNDFNNDTQGLSIIYKSDISKYDHISITNNFAHTDAPIFFKSEIFQEQLSTTGKMDIFRNRFHTDYSRDVTKQMNITFKYNNDMDIFTAANLPNSFYNSIGVESNYTITPNTIFLPSYDFSNRLFEGESDASINTITPGVRQYITKKIYFDGKAGLSFIDSFTDDSLVRPFLDTAFSYEVNNRTLAKMLFTKKVDTNPYTIDILDYWRTTASVAQQLSERFRYSQSIFYGNGEYISFNTSYELVGTNTLLTYDINRSLQGTFSYTFSHVDSNFEAGGYTKNTVFLGLTAEF